VEGGIAMAAKKIWCVEATDMPVDVEMYCVEHEISTHLQNDVALISDDQKNIFTDWLISQGVKIDSRYVWVAIIAT